MPVLDPNGNPASEGCLGWLDFGYDDNIPVYNECDYATCYVELPCLRGYRPATDPKNHSVPWNYVSSADYLTDCDHFIHSYYKVLYAVQRYSNESEYSCRADGPQPESTPEHIQQIEYHPGGCSGSQYRTYSYTYTFIETYWRSYYGAWYNRYHTHEKRLFPYYVFFADEPETPPGWRFPPGPNPGPLEPIPYCLNLDGPSKLCEPTVYTYTISIDDYYIPEDDIEIFLSYIGGSAKNNIDFYAPNKIILPSGKNNISFNIEIKNINIFDPKNFKISMLGINIITKEEIYECEEPFIIEINCDEDQKYYDYRKYGTCCDYAPKDFIEWSDYHNYEKFYKLDPIVTKKK